MVWGACNGRKASGRLPNGAEAHNFTRRAQRLIISDIQKTITEPSSQQPDSGAFYAFLGVWREQHASSSRHGVAVDQLRPHQVRCQAAAEGNYSLKHSCFFLADGGRVRQGFARMKRVNERADVDKQHTKIYKTVQDCNPYLKGEQEMNKAGIRVDKRLIKGG